MIKKRIFFLLAVLLLIQLSLPASAGDLFLIKNKKSCAGIVLPENACLTTKYAAEELSNYAKKMTGTSIPIYKAGKALPKGVIPITFSLQGNSCKETIQDKAFLQKCKEIRHDGFAIYAKAGKGLHIRGAKPRSLLYGVYHILRKNGILFLYPHPRGKGDWIPQKSSLIFPEGSLVKNPAFSFRKMTLNGNSRKNQHCYEWFLRNGLQLHIFGVNQKPEVLKLDPILFTGGHALAEALVGGGGKFKERQEALLKEKPHLFGLVNGKRIKAGNTKGCCQPCTSNEETKARMLKNIQNILARFKGRENIRTFCNDDHTVWCECENCKKLDDPKAPRENRHADRWWHFVNYMAKHILTEKNPNQKMKVLAYQTFRFPPRTIQPDPRVLVEICPHYRCYIHPLTDPACSTNRVTFRKMFESWAAKTKSISTFEYHTQMPGATRYLPMERAWIKDLRYYKSLGLAGFGFITRAAYSDFGNRNSPFNLHMWMSLWQQHYMTGFLAWEIHGDAEKELEKINSIFYGKAWKEMKPYRKLLEDALYAPKVHMRYGSNDMTLGRCLDQPQLLAKLTRYLQNAKKLVKDSPLHLERVKQEEYFFQESWVKAYRLYEEIKIKEYKAKRRTSPIVIDGKLDETDWQKAQTAENFTLFTGHQEKADPPTRARILFDSQNLYFAIECMKVAGRPLLPSPGNGIPLAMRGSHIEIFLAPDFLRRKYYHFGISRNGKRFAALTTNSRTRDEKIAIPFQCGITEDKEKWVAEIRFPLHSPMQSIYEGDTWKINIGRSAVNPKGILRPSSWSGGIFHGRENYRSVTFGKKTILRNGDMEGTVRPTPRKDGKKDWIYLSGTVPGGWIFNLHNVGKAELIREKSAGKNCLRITGVNAFVGQYIKLPKDVKEVTLTVKVRGKGEIFSRLFGRKERVGFLKKIDTKGKWMTLSGNIRVPEKASSFWFRITGTIDLDDAVITPLESLDDTMPTAEKHK